MGDKEEGFKAASIICSLPRSLDSTIGLLGGGALSEGLTVIGCLLLTTAVATPPPTNAPAANMAARISVELDILGDNSLKVEGCIQASN